MCAARACLCMCGTFAVGGVLLPQARVRLARRVLVRPEPVLPAGHRAPVSPQTTARRTHAPSVAHWSPNHSPTHTRPVTRPLASTRTHKTPNSSHPYRTSPFPNTQTSSQIPAARSSAAATFTSPWLAAPSHAAVAVRHCASRRQATPRLQCEVASRPKSPVDGRPSIGGLRRQAMPRLQCGTAPLAAPALPLWQ